MDFLIDERFFKNNKRAGLIILGLASLLSDPFSTQPSPTLTLAAQIPTKKTRKKIIPNKEGLRVS